MRILAISGGSGEPGERAQALATAAGISLYEAQRHLAAGGPRVLATYADPALAGAVAGALAAAGFPSIVLDDETARDRFLVRSFALGARTLGVTDHQGTRLEVPFASMAVMVRGIRALGPDDREPFVDVHVPEHPVLAFCERHVQYDGLHLERQPTATANFVRLIERLREQAPQARYDDRLNTRAGQLALLGERLTPEAHLEIASLVLARALQRLAAAA